MGIIVSIVIAVIGGLIIDSLRTRSKNTTKVLSYKNEVFADFSELFKSPDNSSNEKINQLSHKVYHLAFLNAGKKPVQLGQLNMINLPEQLKQQSKHIVVFDTIKKSLQTTLDAVKINKYKMSYTEELQTFDVMVNEITNIVKDINN